MSRFDNSKIKAMFGGKGFYIALALCRLAAGTIGYITLFSSDSPVKEPDPVIEIKPTPVTPVPAAPTKPVIQSEPVEVPVQEAETVIEEPVELLPLAEETVRGLHDAAEAKNVTMTVTGENVTVRAARRLLSEILYNLCDNAIKYNVPGGSVTVDVGLCGESAVLTVTDTGIGIPPEHQARVFERFYRVDKSHSRQSGGTGLGLSIVKHAVGDLGGGLHLDSTPGQGTTIRVTVPLEPQEE